MSRFWQRGDDLERRLREERPTPSPLLVEALREQIDAREPARSVPRFRLGIAAAVTAISVTAVASFGGVGYAATSVRHAVTVIADVATPAQHHAQPQATLSAAAAQYGHKVSVCSVGQNGKQRTLSISGSALASYLATHPSAYSGACVAHTGTKVPRPNVCVKANGKLVPIYVPPAKKKAYLKRNHGAHATTTGKC